MTDIIPSRSMIQSESVAARSAVSESLLTIVEAESNFINTYQNNSKAFWLNGPYRGDNLNGIDGIFVFPFNAEIVSLTMSNLVSGASGSTVFDVLKMATPGDAGTSIFSITPKIKSASTDNSWLVSDLVDGNNVNPVGTFLPTFTSTTFLKGEAMKATLIDAMVGAQTCGLTIYFRPIN